MFEHLKSCKIVLFVYIWYNFRVFLNKGLNICSVMVCFSFIGKGPDVLESLPHSYFTLNPNAVLQFITHVLKLVSHKFVVGLQALLRWTKKVKLFQNLKRVALSPIIGLLINLEQFFNSYFEVKAFNRMQM